MLLALRQYTVYYHDLQSCHQQQGAQLNVADCAARVPLSLTRLL